MAPKSVPYPCSLCSRINRHPAPSAASPLVPRHLPHQGDTNKSWVKETLITVDLLIALLVAQRLAICLSLKWRSTWLIQLIGGLLRIGIKKGLGIYIISECKDMQLCKIVLFEKLFVLCIVFYYELWWIIHLCHCVPTTTVFCLHM
jgi:hypothetical protein